MIPFRFGASGGNLQNGGAWHFHNEVLYGMGVIGKGVGLVAAGRDAAGKALAEGYCSQVNVLDDVVYYLSLPNPAKETGHITCVPADGSEKARELGTDAAVFMLVAGDRIFYTLDRTGHLYSMNTDGTDRKLLVEAKCGKLGGDGNIIYFENDTDKLFCMLDLASGKITSIPLDYSGYGQLLDGMIYYRDSNKRLCSCKADGSDQKALTKGAVDGVNVSASGIYYANLADKGNPYRMNLDGTQAVKLAAASVQFINTAGDSLYLINKKKFTIYLLDGAGKLTKMQ